MGSCLLAGGVCRRRRCGEPVAGQRREGRGRKERTDRRRPHPVDRGRVRRLLARVRGVLRRVGADRSFGCFGELYGDVERGGQRRPGPDGRAADRLRRRYDARGRGASGGRRTNLHSSASGSRRPPITRISASRAAVRSKRSTGPNGRRWPPTLLRRDTKVRAAAGISSWLRADSLRWDRSM